jgi:CheY-like chemotaxis protein
MPQESLPTETVEAQVRRSQRMETIGRLTGGVVHDFNNILTVITGTIEVLAQAVADRPDLAAIAGLIDQAAARGASLTSHLLAFAHGQRSQPRAVDVNALLVDAARLLRPTLGERIEIDAIPAGDAWSAPVDPDALMTAILNLAIDAGDAMPQGGKLTFETVTAGPEVRNGGADGELPAAQHPMIAVNASSYGTAAGHADRAFIDLGIAEDCIRRCNGRIEVCREAGHGSSVRIYLPRAAGFTQLPTEDCCEGGDEAILIAEDDLLLRTYIVTQLQGLGYRTLTAGSAGEVLTIIDKGEKIDLLFTDVIMPGSIDGRQLAAEALDRRPSLKLLYSSGYAESAMVDDGRLEAGVLLLAKPYRRADLARMIRTALAG